MKENCSAKWSGPQNNENIPDEDSRRKAALRDAAARPKHRPTQTIEQTALLVAELKAQHRALESQSRALLRAQQELEHSHDRYSELYDFAPIGYISICGAGVIRQINSGAAAIFGMNRRRLIGSRIFRRFNELSQEPLRRHLRDVFGSGVSQNCELEIRRGAESIFVRLVSKSGFDRVTGQVHCLCTITDASESRRSDIALRYQSELNRVITENAASALILLDDQGHPTFMNPASVALTGYTLEDLQGRELYSEMFNTRPDGADERFSCLCLAFRQFLPLRDYQDTLHRKDGSTAQVACSLTPFEGCGGPSGAVLELRDIGHQLRVEEVLREEARRKDEFLAMLSHELRGPLAAINSALQLSQRPGMESRREWCQQVAKRQVKQLSRLIDDLLDLSRITRGKIELRKSAFDFRQLLANAIDVVQPMIEERKQVFTAPESSEPIWICGDAARLEQVVVNLLTNASKYTPAGGNISMTLRLKDSTMALEVSDSGVGIHADLLGKIFDLFMQAERTLDRSQGGLGIGLTLVRKLAEMHGGSVTAASPGLGHGSTFTLNLGLLQPPQLAESAGPVEREGGEKNRRILVVDDNHDTADTTAMFLQSAGHSVSRVYDGLAALDAARKLKPDIALLDIGLPGMDGYELASQFRKEESLRGTLLIAVSGYGQKEDRKRSKDAGFNHHLVKPLDFDQLMPILREANLDVRSACG